MSRVLDKVALELYKGTLESTGQIVAVKKLDTESLQGDKEFLVEILMLSLIRHPNLVTMIGYCSEQDQRLLIYEFVPLGSLEHHLHALQPNQQPLDWKTRLMIAYEAAKGLHYLHNEADPPVIHRDPKSANILLDEGFHPKLSDFGLARFGPRENQTHVSTRVMGTQGYCAPEYASSGKLSTKSDIFSFGVVLLELITGRSALDCRFGRTRQLVEWARPLMRDRRKCVQMVDPRLQGQWSVRTMKMTIQVASMCLREDPSFRPAVAEILQALHYLVSRQTREPYYIINSSRQNDEDCPKEGRSILVD